MAERQTLTPEDISRIIHARNQYESIGIPYPCTNVKQMTAITFYVQVVKALDDIGAPYMIVGTFGGYPYGITRATYDIDILVDL